jgi:hypothetical protein
MPPSARGRNTEASSGTVVRGPYMPRVLTSSPVALASAAISIIALEPSTKLDSIFGFIRLPAASAATLSGVAVGSIGLFLPLPAQTTSKDRSRA